MTLAVQYGTMKKKRFYEELMVGNLIFIINEDSHDNYLLLKQGVKKYATKFKRVSCKEIDFPVQHIDKNILSLENLEYIDLSQNKIYFDLIQSILDGANQEIQSENISDVTDRNVPKSNSKEEIDDITTYKYSIDELSIIEKNTCYILNKFSLNEKEQD